MVAKILKQEAINAVSDCRKKETTIFIKNWVYKEKLILAESKSMVTLIGESLDSTIITYDDYNQKKNIFGEDKGTSGSSGFYIYGPGFSAENLTFSNTAGPVAQAVAVFVAGDKARFKNCRFLGFQDTLYTYGRESRQYYYHCYIEGTVDFIFVHQLLYLIAAPSLVRAAVFILQPLLLEIKSTDMSFSIVI